MDGSAGHWSRLHSRTDEVTPSTESTPPLRFCSRDYIGALLSERDYEKHLFGRDIEKTPHLLRRLRLRLEAWALKGSPVGGFETADRATIFNSEVAVKKRLHHVVSTNARPRSFDGDAVNSKPPEDLAQLLSRETAMKTFGVDNVVSAHPTITAESLKRPCVVESTDAFGDKDEPREPKKPRLDVQHCGTEEPMDIC
ncbi:hypothetical protein MRX96_010464 [Rhipicephalus microplus]